MSKLSRRSLLAATTASIATRALPAFAAAHYSLKHGAFELTIVSDGHLVLPTSFLAPGAPPAARDALLRAAGQTGEQYNSPTNVTLIRAGTDLILVDMGSGDRFMPTAGKLWDNLKAAGIDKSKITKVIFTHGHPDHLWGTVDELDELVTPGRNLLRCQRGMGFLERRQRDARPAAGTRGFRHRRAAQLRGDQGQGEKGEARR